MDNLANVWSRLIVPELGNTIFMVLFTTIFATIFGFFIAIAMIITYPNGLKPNKILYRLLDILVNIIRSFPFIILAVAIIPFTRALVGSSIGKEAAIVPLTIAAAPFIAKLVESALREVDQGLIEAARSFGASNRQIIWLMMKEAVPSIISGITLSVITILNCTAMAGTIGAGGLGSVALIYGYQGFNEAIMYSIVVILIIMVQILQWIGDYSYRKLK